VRKLIVAIALVFTVVPVVTQKWTPPRTPWGDPDLQGLWPSWQLLSVPLERPVELGTKAMLADEEFARLPAQSRLPGANDLFNQGGSRAAAMEHGTPQRQTSFIVDPPDGRMPPLTAEGARRAAALPKVDGPHDGPENFTPAERCLSRGLIGSMLPVGSTNGHQIIQAPGSVVILNEMLHEARVIPVDGRPHLAVRRYMGDSRGRWEGQTLVVETINFNENSNYIGGGGRRNPSFSRDARVTERFTLIDANTLRYEATVEDPTTWTKAWTIALPLKRDPTYQLFEYACHEENYSMPHMLRGTRIDDALDITGERHTVLDKR
jgi:hypothetical protein